jgi:hypothetical protein
MSSNFPRRKTKQKLKSSDFHEKTWLSHQIFPRENNKTTKKIKILVM